MTKRLVIVCFLLGCRKEPSAADAAPIASAAASTPPIASVVAPKPPLDVVAVVHAWNDATNAHDAKKLGDLYADDVELYGTKMSRDKAVATKNAAFAKHDHDTLGPITVMGHTATFDKSSRSKDGKVIQVSGYIDVDASKKIVAEGDTTTDANLNRRKQNQCSAAVIALVQSTPEGKADPSKQIWTEPPPHAGGPWRVNGTMTTGGQRIDEHTIQGFQVWTDVFEVDARAGTAVFVGTSVAGPTDSEYQMHTSGKTLAPDAAAVAKVRAACN